MANKGRKVSRSRLLILIIILAVAAAVYKLMPATEGGPKDGSGNLEVTFIDVGQGDSTLLEAPNGTTVLIDGGEYDAYDEELKPYLDSERIEKVDIAVATHYHSDHMGGILKLVKAGRAKKLILPDYPDTDDTRRNLENVARKTDTLVEYISRGGTVETDCPGLSIKALHPQKGGSEGNNFHNNSSVVLKVNYGGTDILITGDIESRVEKQIIKESDVECDILKVAHHGSSSSSSKRFVEAADPTYAVISVGEDNSYGHPHSEILARYEDEDARILRTDRDGDITFVISEKKIEDIKYSK